MLPLAVSNPAKKHILVVEDGTSLRRLLRQLLERLDYNVTTAANGREGIERYREQEFDLVITDLFMPEMDGLELIQKLSAEFPGARIIAMSGASTAADLLSQARRLGARHTFAKPFDTEEFISVIQEELSIAAAA